MPSPIPDRQERPALSPREPDPLDVLTTDQAAEVLGINAGRIPAIRATFGLQEVPYCRGKYFRGAIDALKSQLLAGHVAALRTGGSHPANAAPQPSAPTMRLTMPK